MSNKIKSERMKQRWRDTSGATKAYKAMSEADKCIQRWRSARMRWKDREAMRG